MKEFLFNVYTSELFTAMWGYWVFAYIGVAIIINFRSIKSDRERYIFSTVLYLLRPFLIVFFLLGIYMGFATQSWIPIAVGTLALIIVGRVSWDNRDSRDDLVNDLRLELLGRLKGEGK